MTIADSKGSEPRSWQSKINEPSELDIKPSKKVRAWCSFGVKLTAGISLLGFLFFHYDLHRVLQLLSRERPIMFAATVVLFVSVQFVSAYRWQLLARLNGICGKYRDYLAYYFIGMFTNVFVPGLIGGDALRAYYLGRRHNRIADALGSVVADRGVGLLALFWFAAGASLWIGRQQLPESVLQVTLGLAAVSMLAYLAGPIIWISFSKIRGLNRLLTPMIPYVSRPISLIPAIALSGFLQFAFALCQYLLGLGLGLQVPLTTFLLIVPIANVVASLPVTINGLGLREASYLLLLGLAGVSRDQAVALSILYFAATLSAGLTGIIPFIATPMPRGEVVANEYELTDKNRMHGSGSPEHTGQLIEPETIGIRL